ncbi:Rap guanine nucleotide exchange factor 4 [Balamuthia mandrillaris]
MAAEAEQVVLSKRQAFEGLAKNLVATKDDATFELACANEQQGNKKYSVDRMLEFLKMWWDMHPDDFTRANVNLLLTAIKARRPEALNHFKLLFLKPSNGSNGGSTPKLNPQRSRDHFSYAIPTEACSSSPHPEKEEASDGTNVRLKRCSFASQLRGAEKRAAGTSATRDFLEVSSSQLAREMTMLDFELFNKVQCKEFLHHVWHFSSRHVLAPNITAYIARFNEVSYWVVTEILMTRRKEQAMVLRKFIRLANGFLHLNNFNGMIMIMSALNNSTIVRLKDAWAGLGEKEMATFRNLEELLCNQQNFSNYFQEFKKRPFPKVPYFALFLRDCTFINDGNKPYNRHGMINFEFMTMLYQCLSAVRDCQRHPYDLLRHKDIQSFLCCLQFIDDEDALYLLSLKAQPGLWTNEAVRDVAKEERGSSDRLSYDGPVTTSSNMGDATNEDLTLDSYSEDEAYEKAQARDIVGAKEATVGKKRRKQRKKLVLDTEALTKEKMVLRTVKEVPAALVPMLLKAEQVVDQYYSNCVRSVLDGTINIHLKNWMKNGDGADDGNERLILLRATAMSVDFFTSLRENFGFFGLAKKQLQTVAQTHQAQAMLTGFGFGSASPSSSNAAGGGAESGKREGSFAEEESVFQDYTEEVSAKMLYDFGYLTAMGDCKAFSKFTGATGLELWSMGPILCNYSGQSKAKLKSQDDESGLNPEDPYSLAELIFCFESESWLRRKLPLPKMNPVLFPKGKAKHTSVCHSTCGYIAGWSTAALGKEIASVEPLCRARGDPICTFVLALPSRLNHYLRFFYHRNNLPDMSHQVLKYNVLDTKEAFAFSTKAILAGDQVAAAPSSSSASLPSLSPVVSKDKKKMMAVKFPVVGRKRLPGKLESKLDNAELVSTTTREDLAQQEDIKAKQHAIFEQLFSKFVCDPLNGEVSLEGKEKYIFMRAETLSTGFYQVISSLMTQREEQQKHRHEEEGVAVVARSFATNFLYDLGRCFAHSDFAFFKHVIPSQRLASKEEQWLQQVFSLPEILRNVGWGKLTVASSLSILNFDPKNHFKHFLLRYTVKDSFEAAAYLKDQWTKAKHQYDAQQQSSNKGKSNGLKQLRVQHVQHSPVCILNCGFVNCFLEECIHELSSSSSSTKKSKEEGSGEEGRVQLGTVEVSCVACGHERCEFLVAPAELMFAHVMRYLKENGREGEVSWLRGLEIVMRRFKDGRGYFSRLFRK